MKSVFRSNQHDKSGSSWGRSASSAGTAARQQQQQQYNDFAHLTASPSPSYRAPNPSSLSPPPPSTSAKASALLSSYGPGAQQIYPAGPERTPSRTSQVSSQGSGGSSHPYAAMSPSQPVIAGTVDDDNDCPVCLEPLSFSFRLPGEKPHIIPECGHALHEACFTAVYGPSPSQQRAGSLPRKNLGVCGVCRRPMKVGDGDGGGKSNKLAALTGMGDRATPSLYPGASGGAGGAASQRYDPSQDDPIDGPAHRPGQNNADLQQYIVAPSIQVRPEFPSLTRTNDPAQPLTSIVIIELAGRKDRGHVQASPSVPNAPYSNGSVRNGNGNAGLNGLNNSMNSMNLNGGGNGYNGAAALSRDTTMSSSRSAPHGSVNHDQGTIRSQNSNYSLHQREPSPPTNYGSPSSNGTNNNYTATSPVTDPYSPSSGEASSPPYTAASPPAPRTDDSAFSTIVEDLRNRIIDWKGHPLSGLGPLQMFDLLSVRRDTLIRDFFVYLFREALICVVEEKKRSLGRFLSGADNASGVSSTSSASAKGVLRLRGRIYIRHIKQVTDTSVTGEMSLTIDMEDERLESFILVFKDRSSLESWKSNIQNLVSAFHQNGGAVGGGGGVSGSGRTAVPQMERPELEEFGGSEKAARMLSGGSASTSHNSHGTAESLLNGSGRSTMSSSTSYGSQQLHQQQQQQQQQSNSYGNMNGSMRVNGMGMQQKLSTLGEDEELESNYDTSLSAQVTPHVRGDASNSLSPLVHPAMDLILVISLPPPTSQPSTAALKIRVIKTSLDFIIASLGGRDRLSIVTFEVGIGGKVRKTPFLSCGKAASRERLMRFVDEVGVRREENMPYEDEFLVRASKDEKTDVVTAVNHGLDVVLQRKARNPIGGMILISDAADTTRRAQMDLVLARAEAGNVPIHSFGYGRSHDPASLWLMSNHTGGTYTFVKDWYDLRDCLAGVVGGMMSIGLINMKIHMKIVDGHKFRIRKVSGGPSSIVSSDGRNVDVEIGELRYGERKEMLVELELDNNETSNGMLGPNGRPLNATDQFVARMGLDSSAFGDSSDFADGMMNRMIDEVPVFEVDGSFFDPNAAKHVSRLAHPVLLTVTVVPNTGSRPRTPSGGSDPVIVRRRMELLASDMITRALVLVSRKNYPQAQKIMSETKRILHTVLQTVSQSLPPPNSSGSTIRTRKELLTLSVVRALQAILQDLQVLSEALEDNVDLFAHDQRNFGAQQAMILRDQKGWSGRTATEKLFWTADNSIELVSRSADWVARE